MMVGKRVHRLMELGGRKEEVQQKMYILACYSRLIMLKLRAKVEHLIKYNDFPTASTPSSANSSAERYKLHICDTAA
jgi:hypothetical protein